MTYNDTFARMFDGVDWQLTLYENGKQDYDETIRAIINTVQVIATDARRTDPPAEEEA